MSLKSSLIPLLFMCSFFVIKTPLHIKISKRVKNRNFFINFVTLFQIHVQNNLSDVIYMIEEIKHPYISKSGHDAILSIQKPKKAPLIKNEKRHFF